MLFDNLIAGNIYAAHIHIQIRTMSSFTTPQSSLVLAGRGGYNAPMDCGRGGYNGPASTQRGPNDDDEPEDGRGGYN